MTFWTMSCQTSLHSFCYPDWGFPTLTEVFPCFSLVVRQMPGYNSQRCSMVHTLPIDHSGFESQKAFQPKLLIVLFCVLFVCKCVLYHCHRLATQLQLTNISISITDPRQHSLPVAVFGAVKTEYWKTETTCVYSQLVTVQLQVDVSCLLNFRRLTSTIVDVLHR